MRTLWILALFTTMRLAAAEPGSSVIVIYNSRIPESKQVAEYYAEKRHVPKNQIFGFAFSKDPKDEGMTRSDFVDGLQKPLLKQLERSELFRLAAVPTGSNAVPPGVSGRRVVGSTIRYAVLCYGVPTKILRDEKLVEAAAEQLPAELRRNEASVDSQLACLPVSELNLPWVGPLTNPFYGTTNAALLNPTNGILLVTRLDGPTP